MLDQYVVSFRCHTKSNKIPQLHHIFSSLPSSLSAYHGHLMSLIDISPYKFRKLSGQKDWVHVVCKMLTHTNIYKTVTAALIRPFKLLTLKTVSYIKALKIHSLGLNQLLLQVSITYRISLFSLCFVVSLARVSPGPVARYLQGAVQRRPPRPGSGLRWHSQGLDRPGPPKRSQGETQSSGRQLEQRISSCSWGRSYNHL